MVIMSAIHMHRRSTGLWAGVLTLLLMAGAPAARAEIPAGPLAGLQTQLDAAVMRAPGRVGIALEDLATGKVLGVNAGASLPAASTIKIPVMVEVFRQMRDTALDLDTKVKLRASDRDWGSGDLCDAPPGTVRTVRDLLWLMITSSDNTATNMLIRRVGRTHINNEMAELGLRDTRLGDYIRSETDAIRYALRTSPRDMVSLLDSIARNRLIDEWSSREMLAILTGQLHNGLLPAALPKSVKIAHKTGSLHDTLNDVGIVYHDDEPYVIAVMTTQLTDLDLGRAFIRKVSRIAYSEFERFGAYRETAGAPGFNVGGPASGDALTGSADQNLAPDLQMWDSPPTPQ
jgi:beta-lactamase class A